MGVWSIAILDGGVSNAFEAAHGANRYERDFVGRDFETDPGTFTHGTNVAMSAEMVNARLDRIDLRVMSTSGAVSDANSTLGLNHVAELHDAGWNIGAVNVSWGSSVDRGLSDEFSRLQSRGIISVAASGNGGSSQFLETAIYPARYSNVISVGSHDGAGNPTWFSHNSPSSVHVLADGENFPGPGIFGTSFSAPQVTATVGTVQALAGAVLGETLGFYEVVDVLQLGGAGPRSAADPASPSTTYFQHTHQGSVDYFLNVYIDPEFSPLEYLASNQDLLPIFGGDLAGARDHLINNGIYEGREVSFDGLLYIASHPDLIGALGADRQAGASHFLNEGRFTGRATTFDAESYLAANRDLFQVFGDDLDDAARHYITSGFAEGRPTSGTMVQPSISEGAVDFAASTATPGYIAVGGAVTGNISFTFDRDWFRTDLAAGETVLIEARGSWTGGGTLYDPMARIYNQSGSYLAGDDDSGVGLESRFTFTAPTTGTYYVEADGWGSRRGTYTLSMVRTRRSEVLGEAEPLAADDWEPADVMQLVAGEEDDHGIESLATKDPTLYYGPGETAPEEASSSGASSDWWMA
jgi:hypothetical protein